MGSRKQRARSPLGAVALVAVVLAVGSMTACEPDPPPPLPDGAYKVLVIGDSLTVGSVNAGLLRQGRTDWTVSADEGRSTNRGIAIADNRNLAYYDLIVVALGTNDYLDTRGTYGWRIDNMMRVIGPDKPVVWVNVDVQTSKLRPAGKTVNPAIVDAAARHPNLTLGDWALHAKHYPGMAGLRASDGVHYTSAGYTVRAQWMESLVPDPPVPDPPVPDPPVTGTLQP